jgi:hypothetical protein
MTRYAYAEVGDMYFASTEPQLVEWYLGECNKGVTSAKPRANVVHLSEAIRGTSMRLLTTGDGTVSRVCIGSDTRDLKQLNGETLKWRTLRRLCQDGWEPFSTDQGRVALRKRLED